MRGKTQHPTISKSERQINPVRKFSGYKRKGERNRISNGVKGRFAPRRPKSRKEEAEFGLGKMDILFCKKCGAVYWYKSWHHKLSDYPELKKFAWAHSHIPRLKAEGCAIRMLKFVLCPACQQILDKKYEGEIILEAVPENFKENIKTLAENYGKRAFRADPMDRIISIKEKRVKRVTAERKRGATSRKEFEGQSYIRILATENQLAIRLAKKINEIYGGKLSVSISHSHKEDVARIRITF